MTAARDFGKGPPEDEAGAVESTSRKKKARVAVSIRKGNLLFFPTALPDALDARARLVAPGTRDEEDEPEGV